MTKGDFQFHNKIVKEKIHEFIGRLLCSRRNETL